MASLNVGSGQRPFAAPFFNLDIQATVTLDGKPYKPDVVGDCLELPFGEGLFDVVVAHHCLEHMDAYREGQQMIREAYRVLRTGGSFIVTVPDIKALARRWLMHQIPDYIYITNLYGAYMGSEYDRHKHGYCEEELRGKLTSASGWHEVKMFDWREIKGASIARDWWVLGMEATK